MFNISTTSTLILSINSISSVWNYIAISSQDMSCISTASYVRFSKGFRPCKNFFSRNRIIVIAKNIRHIYLTKSRWKQLESNQHLGFLKHLKKCRWPVFLQNRLIIRALPLSYVPIKCTLLRFFIYPFPQATYYLLLIIANSVLALQVPILLSIKWNGY